MARSIKNNYFCALRRPWRLFAIASAALIACVAVTFGSPSAEASVSAAKALLAPQGIGAEKLQGLRVEEVARRRFKGRRGRRHHGRRDQHGQGQHQIGTPDKPTGGPKQGPKQTDNRPDNRPDNKPGRGGNRPGRDHGGGGQVVCIGGKVFSRRCLCHGRERGKLFRNAVFVCGRPGRQPVIPQISAINPGPALAAGPVSALAMNTPPPNSAGDAAPPAQQQPQAQQAPALPQFVPDQVLVTVPRTVPQTVDSDVAQSFGLQLLGQWALDLIDTRLVLYRISDGREVPAVVALLQGDARVTGPQPNFYYRPQAASEQSAEPVEDLQYALVKLDIDHAQSIARGRDVLVAVIDTEIDATHPDLAGAVIEKFDATDGNKPAPGDHGTSIAGIIRAHGVMRGIAPEAKLLGISAFASTGGEGASPAATTASLLRGMDWALTKRARIINMSFTGPRDTLLEQGIQAAARRKAILVAAAGNAGPGAPEAFPAAYPEVIAVTATDVADHLYVSANQGAYIDVAAPGVDVLAPGLEHAHILQSGTSFAAAHISGIVALMLELNPDLTSDDARDALMNGARDLGPPGQDEQFGAGRADAFAALQLID